jgi:hypothetical protein
MWQESLPVVIQGTITASQPSLKLSLDDYQQMLDVEPSAVAILIVF